jgi:endonuclease G
MMNKKFFLVAALGAAMMTSCSEEHGLSDLQPDAPSGKSVAAKFASSINGAIPQTRAVSSWTSGDAIGIFMVDDVPAVVDLMTNKAFTTTGATLFTPKTAGDSIFFPANGSTVNFISYYPYQSGVTLGDYAVDVSAQSNSIDLLYAKTTAGYSKTSVSKTVKLDFYHQLTHLVMSTIPGDGLTEADLQGMTVTIKGMNTQTTFDLTDGTLDAATGQANIVTSEISDGEKYDAILVPQSVSDNAVTVEFTLATNETFVWKVPARNFEAKTEHNYTITISRTGIDVEGEIKPWIDGDDGTGTAD